MSSLTTCSVPSALQERLTLLVDERNRLAEAKQKLRVGGAAQQATAKGASTPCTALPHPNQQKLCRIGYLS